MITLLIFHSLFLRVQNNLAKLTQQDVRANQETFMN